MFYVRNGELVTNILYFSSLERLFIRETDRIRFEINNQQFNYSDLSLIENAFNSVRFERIGDQGTLTINGESQTLTVLTSTWRFNEIGRVSGAGHLKGFFVNFQSSNGPSYLGYGPTPWKDLNGSNDGTPIGTFATVAQLRTTPPQVLGMDFNIYRKNAESAANVTFTPVPLSDGDSVIFRLLSLSGISHVILRNDPINRIEITANARLRIRTNNVNTQYNGISRGLVAGDLVTVTQISATSYQVEYNGESEIKGTDGSLGAINKLYSTTTHWISNLSFSNGLHYLGYGPTPWKDLNGNNNGTESGTFENVLVPASLSNSSLDAFGNPLSPIEIVTPADPENVTGFTVAGPDDGSGSYTLVGVGSFGQGIWESGDFRIFPVAQDWYLNQISTGDTLWQTNNSAGAFFLYPWDDTQTWEDDAGSGSAPTFSNPVGGDWNESVELQAHLRERDEFNFDGSGYAVVPYDPSLDVTDEFSVVIDSFDFDPTTAQERVISRYDVSNTERIWTINVNNPNAPSSGFNIGFGDPSNANIGIFKARYDWPLTTAGTYKLAFVYDGKLPASERIKLYTQDGAQSGSLGSGNVPASLPQFDQDLVIGANDDGSDQLATTRAGGIRHYTRALTVDELSSFFLNPNSVFPYSFPIPLP